MLASFRPEKPLSGWKLAPLLPWEKEEARKPEDYLTTLLFLFAKNIR